MKPMQSSKALERAIAKYPSLKAFSNALGVRYQTVQQWLVNGVPVEYCSQIEEVTGGECRCEDLNGRVNWDHLWATYAAREPA